MGLSLFFGVEFSAWWGPRSLFDLLFRDLRQDVVSSYVKGIVLFWQNMICAQPICEVPLLWRSWVLKKLRYLLSTRVAQMTFVVVLSLLSLFVNFPSVPPLFKVQWKSRTQLPCTSETNMQLGCIPILSWSGCQICRGYVTFKMFLKWFSTALTALSILPWV